MDFFERLVAKFSPDLGVDLGSDWLGLVECGQAQWREAARVVYYLPQDQLSAWGAKARLLEGRLLPTSKLVSPFRRGRILDYRGALELGRQLLRRCHNVGLGGPRLTLALPVNASGLERQLACDWGRALGARAWSIVPTPLAAALGAGLELLCCAEAHLLVDIGAQSLQVALLSWGGVVAADSLPQGSDALDRALIEYCRAERGLVVGRASAEHLKIEGGCAWTLKRREEFSIKGRDLASGLPRRQKLSAKELLQIYKPHLERWSRFIQSFLQAAPPQLASDIMAGGLTLCGGGSLLQGLEQYLASSLGLICQRASEPESCTLRGLDRLGRDPRLRQALALNQNFVWSPSGR